MSDDLTADLAEYGTADPISDETVELLTTDPAAPVPGWEGAFRLDTDRMAEWALRKRALAERRIEEARAVADAERARVTSWLEQTTATPARDIAFFDSLLEDYARRQRAEHDRKTLSLPHGTVKTTTVKASAKLTDEAALRELLRAAGHTDLITTVELIPSVAALVRDGILTVADGQVVVAATGEVVPAEVVHVEPERVSVKVVTS